QVRRRLGGRLVEGAADLQELVVVHGRLRVGPTPLSPTGGRHASLPRATAAPRMYPFRKAANGTRAIDRGGANGQSSSRHRPAQGGSEEAPHALAHPTPEVEDVERRECSAERRFCGPGAPLSALYIVRPPSTTITCPVISAVPVARKTTASAMSSGVAARPIGVSASDFSTMSS